MAARLSRFVPVLAFAAALHGCAAGGGLFATQARLGYEGDVRPLEEVAVVMGDGVVTFVGVNGKPLDQHRRLGPRLWAGGFLLIDVAPGPNVFELCFSYATPAGSPGPGGPGGPAYRYEASPRYGGGPAYTSGFCRETVAVTLDAERGRIYQARFRPLRGTLWTADFVDVTEARRADIAERRRELAGYVPER